MSAPSVNCNLCGSSLEITPTTNFATCGSCGAKLAIKRTATSIFTEPAGDEPNGPLADQLNQLKLQNEVYRIDLEWQKEREPLLLHSKYGAYPPTKGQRTVAIVLGVVVTIGFGILTASLPGARATGAPLWGGGLLLLFFIGLAIYSNRKFEAYKRAEAAYLGRREAARARHRGEASGG